MKYKIRSRKLYYNLIKYSKRKTKKCWIIKNITMPKNCQKRKHCSKHKHHKKKEDPIIGTWLFNAFSEDEPDRLSPEVIQFRADKSLTYLFLDIPLAGLPPFSGSKALGMWRRKCRGIYEFVSAERLGFVLPLEDSPCCGAENSFISRNTVTLTLDKNDKNKATIEGRFEAFGPADICYEGPVQFAFNFTGDLCRFRFPE